MFPEKETTTTKPQLGMGTSPLLASKKSPVDQIPSSTPIGWKGGTGPRESSTEFSRGLSNTAAALAPIGGPVVAGVLKGAAKLATGAASPIVQGVLAPTVPLAAGVSLLSAAEADSRSPAAQINGSGVGSAAAPRGPGGVPGPATGGVAPAGDEVPGLGMVGVLRQPNGVMEFSGENISGPVSYQGAQAAGFKPRGAGVSVVPGMAPGEARAILDRPFDPRNAMSAEQRFQYDKEVKNAQGVNAFNAGMNPRKTTIDDLLRSRLANSAARRQATTDQTEIARGVADLGVRRQAESELNSESERSARANTVAESQQLQTARSEYLTADTDEKRSVAAKKLMALQGKSEASPGYTVVPGEEYTAPDGNGGLVKLRGPALVLDNRTGKVVDTAAQARRGEGTRRPGARPEKYEVGKTYTVGDRKVRVVGLDAQSQPQFEEVR